MDCEQYVVMTMMRLIKDFENELKSDDERDEWVGLNRIDNFE
jgi:hypothetical protein